MPAPRKLTEQERQEKKQRDQLIIAHNRVTSAWSFGQIKTWWDVMSKLGYSPDYVRDHPELYEGRNAHSQVSFPDLKQYLQKQKDELEKKITSQKEKVTGQEVVIVVQERPTVGKEDMVPKETAATIVNTNVNTGTRDDSSRNTASSEDTKRTSENNYGLKPSPNEKCFLFWFQKRAASELLEGLGL